MGTLNYDETSKGKSFEDLEEVEEVTTEEVFVADDKTEVEVEEVE